MVRAFNLRAIAAALLVLCSAVVCVPPATATVTTSTRSVTYTPSSPTSVFAVTYPFLSAAHLLVQKIQISPPTTVTLTQGTDYTVTMPRGTANGYITTTAAIGSGYQVVIQRRTPVTQATSYKTQGSFRPAAHEEGFDKLTMIAQELAAGAAVTGDVATAIATHEGAPDPHTGYLKLAGRSGGQTASGGTGASEALTLNSTDHATKGKINLGSGSAFDDATERLGIGITSPGYGVDVVGDMRVSSDTLFEGTIYGSTASGGDLDLASTTHGTKGKINLGQLSVYDDQNGRLGLYEVSPEYTLDVYGDASISGTIYGGETAAQDLELQSTAHDTKGRIRFGSGSLFDDVNEAIFLNRTTGDPGVKLHVNGAGGDYGGTVSSDSVAAFEGGSASTAITIGANSGYSRSIYFADQLHAQDGEIEYVGADNAFDFRVNGNAHTVRVSSGGIGIGTTSLANKLTIASGSISLDAAQGIVWGGTTLDNDSWVLGSQGEELKLEAGSGGGGTNASLLMYGSTHGTNPSDIIMDSDRIVLRNESGVQYGELATGTGGASYLNGTFRARLPTANVTTVTTVSASDCGKAFFSTSAGAGLQLPDAAATNAGCEMTLINTLANGTGAMEVRPDVSDEIEGACVGEDGGGAVDVRYQGGVGLDPENTVATQKQGDMIKIVSDGASKWWIVACRGLWTPK